MSKLTYKVSYYVLYAMFAAIVIVMCLFYFGGEMATPLVTDGNPSNPAYTDTLLYLIYGLLGFAVVVTIIGFIMQFGAALKDNPANAIKSLIGVILFIAVLVISWAIASDQPLDIVGYEGTENRDPFWLKITDMFLYSLYFLLAINVLGMILSSIKRRFS